MAGYNAQYALCGDVRPEFGDNNVEIVVRWIKTEADASRAATLLAVETDSQACHITRHKVGDAHLGRRVALGACDGDSQNSWS